MTTESLLAVEDSTTATGIWDLSSSSSSFFLFLSLFLGVSLFSKNKKKRRKSKYPRRLSRLSIL